MKSAYVRIYTEEELHHKIQVVRGMIAQLEREMDFYFCDIPRVEELWIKYETARYVVTRSFEEYDWIDSLFIEREVEDDYDENPKDEAGLHNELIALQFQYNSLISILPNSVKDYVHRIFENKRKLVLEIATDIYRHLSVVEPEENNKMEMILDWLNYDNSLEKWRNEVEYDEVILHAMRKTDDERDMLLLLKDRLNLVEY